MKNLFRISSVYVDFFIRFFSGANQENYEDGKFFYRLDKNLKINSRDVLHKKNINDIANILFKFLSQNLFKITFC